MIAAQNGETVYLQQEHDRLLRVANHESAIQNYILQNIATYTLPSTVATRINMQKHEDESNLTQAEFDEILLATKKQELRTQFFQHNPSVENDYLATPLTEATSCVNNGFEDATTASFEYASQKFNTNWTIFGNFPTVGLNTPTDESGIISLITGSNSKDPITGINRVKSGNHSIRLNNSNDGWWDVSLLRRKIVVGATQDKITFNYALVMQDPQDDHNGTILDNPYYHSRLITSSGIIDINTLIANRKHTQVFKRVGQSDIVYTDWLCESIDVSQFRGQIVTLEVIISDCARNGHWGYAYFDNFCGTKCTAPTFGSVTLDPMGITCPLLPLTVSGNFITPAGYELENLTLTANNGNSVVYTSSPGDYNTSGNEFSFKITGPQLSLTQGTIAQFDFFVKAKFKLIGENSYLEVNSQSANVGPDVTFNSSCKICNACTPPVKSFWFQGRYPYGTHNNGINSWVDYIDSNGLTVRKIIGPFENGCQKIEAISIIDKNEVLDCNPIED